MLSVPHLYTWLCSYRVLRRNSSEGECHFCPSGSTERDGIFFVGCHRWAMGIYSDTWTEIFFSSSLGGSSYFQKLEKNIPRNTFHNFSLLGKSKRWTFNYGVCWKFTKFFSCQFISHGFFLKTVSFTKAPRVFLNSRIIVLLRLPGNRDRCGFPHPIAIFPSFLPYFPFQPLLHIPRFPFFLFSFSLDVISPAALAMEVGSNRPSHVL